jgi:hypothetical protein
MTLGGQTMRNMNDSDITKFVSEMSDKIRELRIPLNEYDITYIRGVVVTTMRRARWPLASDNIDAMFTLFTDAMERKANPSLWPSGSWVLLSKWFDDEIRPFVRTEKLEDHKA